MKRFEMPMQMIMETTKLPMAPARILRRKQRKTVMIMPTRKTRNQITLPPNRRHLLHNQ